MRKPNPTQTETTEPTTPPQVRSAFLRHGAVHCQWPADFVPPVDSDEPVIEDLAHRLWQSARPELETIGEGLNRLVFNQAIDRASSAIFASADIGIKPLAQAKDVLARSFEAIEAACELSRSADTAPESTAAMPALVARFDATPPALADQTPGLAHLSLALGDVVLNVEVKVPSQSWLYRGYSRLKSGVESVVDRVEAITAYRPAPGRMGMMTDDRELTVGLRRVRSQDGDRPHRETTLSLRSKK